jgi:D-amino-acid dehydrogenase
VLAIAGALAALLGRVYDDLVPMLAALGLSGDLHRTGALTLYNSMSALRADAEEWRLKRQHGIECVELSGAEARAREPALARGVAAAIATPAWSNVADPKVIWAALLADLRRRDAAVVARTVRSLAELAFDRVVVAAGAWSARLAATVGDRVPLESERGYNMTVPDPGIALTQQVIFAERKFVASPLSVGLRIGGAAEFAGLSAPANYARSATLARLAGDYLPGLSVAGGVAWMGQRPATPDSLPVLGASPRRPDVLYAFGHGHLGLTLAASTGRIIADHVAGRPTLDLAPFSAARFR